ncbi:hypothetical protein KJ940_14970 [Myxococcota bacterium]|nr:hypothetical protein [Myxococcota bacterium]
MAGVARRSVFIYALLGLFMGCEEEAAPGTAPDVAGEAEITPPILDQGALEADEGVEGVDEGVTPRRDGGVGADARVSPPLDVGVEGRCGDGVRDPGEACDDGDQDNTNACTNTCQPNITGLCAPCLDDADCGDGGLCLPIGAGRACGINCEAAACPGGYACRDVMDAGAFRGRQCMPLSGACQGEPCLDSDGDLICDEVDPCLGDPTLDQDQDGIPDACDCDGPTPPCGPGGACRQEGGGFICGCGEGFIEAAGGCQDIDECATQAHDCAAEAACQNTLGGFECACLPGFVGDGRACAPATPCDPQLSACGLNAACLADPFGDFFCACDEGFSGDGLTCEDIDECAIGVDNCDPNAACQNQLGGFSCVCEPGFRGGGVVCEDIDECAFDGHNCAQICLNTPGGFECQCEAGFALNPDGRACDPVIGACQPACDINADCLNGACVCRFGFEGDGLSCQPLPEGACGICDPHAACINDVCVCGPGWEGDGGQCRDVNECQLGLDNCHPTARCSNTLGGFNCTCPEGALGDGVICEVQRVDECAEGLDDCDPLAECFDEAVGYRCACPAGYEGDGRACQDIDECLAAPCQRACVNTPGAFECQCEVGEALNPDGRTCALAANCAVDGDCHDQARCLDGLCACLPGFRGDGFDCQDIDECAEFLSGCSLRAECTNTIGEFECECPPGYIGDGFICDPPLMNQCVDNNDCENEMLACGEFRVSAQNSPELWCRFITEGAARGAPCQEDAECAEGLCLFSANTCSVGCDDDADCGPGMICGYFRYVSGALEMCAPACLGSTDCRHGNLCVINLDLGHNTYELMCEQPGGLQDIGAPVNDPSECRHSTVLDFTNAQGQTYRGCSAPCEPSRGGADCVSTFPNNPYRACGPTLWPNPNGGSTRINMCMSP